MNYRVLSAAAVAAFSLPLFAVSSEPNGEAAALMAKHEAYVGWHAGDGVVKTLREVGNLTRAGKKLSDLEYRRIGIAHRSVGIDQHGIEYDSGFTGSVYWTANENGFTVRPVGEVARYFYDLEMVRGELTHTLKAALVGHAQVDGADTTVLRLTSEIGFPIDVYVDVATGAYKRIVIDPDGKYEEQMNGIGYTVIDGKRFLSTWHYWSSKSISTYTKIEPNAALTPDDLHPPKQSATWTFGNDVAKVELTKEAFPRIYVDVTVNGVKGKFILDTGAGGTAVLDSFAQQVGAKRIGATTVGTIGGSAKANRYRLDTIALGGSTLHNVVALSGLSENFKSDEGVVGLIGFDLLGGAVVTLNLDDGTLQIEDPAKVAPDQSNGIVLHVDLSEQVMRVPMRINGKHDVIATLDSGNPVNVLFSRDLVTRDRLVFFVKPDEIGGRREGMGAAGMIEIEHCGELTSISLGPIQYAPVPACDSTSFGRNDILVGLDFMQNFNYVFSYPDGIVVLTKRKKS